MDAVVAWPRRWCGYARSNGPALPSVVEDPAVALVAGVMRGFGWDVTVTEVAPGPAVGGRRVIGSRGSAAAPGPVAP